MKRRCIYLSAVVSLAAHDGKPYMLYSLQQVCTLALKYAKLGVRRSQIVEAVSGAVVGLRDQLEALTILDETALTWPGLSLVCC